MKRLVMILTLAGSLIVTSSFAADNNTSPAVMQSFQNAFDGAKEITWEKLGVLYKASFVLDGQYKTAFYNIDGDLIAVAKNMAKGQLPATLLAALKTDGMWISDVFVVSVEGDNTYYVKLENADTTVILKSASAKKWSVYQKAEK